MYGLEAIRAANGWMITVAGIGIVFTGLVVLALVISNLERAIGLWDRRLKSVRIGKPAPRSESARVAAPEEAQPGEQFPSAPSAIHLSPEEAEAMGYFRLITERLGEPFSLQRLLEQAEKRGISNPYHFLDLFLKRNLIVEREGEQRGFYEWRKDADVTVSHA